MNLLRTRRSGEGALILGVRGLNSRNPDNAKGIRARLVCLGSPERFGWDVALQPHSGVVDEALIGATSVTVCEPWGHRRPSTTIKSGADWRVLDGTLLGTAALRGMGLDLPGER